MLLNRLKYRYDAISERNARMDPPSAKRSITVYYLREALIRAAPMMILMMMMMLDSIHETSLFQLLSIWVFDRAWMRLKIDGFSLSNASDQDRLSVWCCIIFSSNEICLLLAKWIR